MEKSQRPIGRPIRDTQQMPTDKLILQNATALFLEKGYRAVSMDEVAKSCNITKATVYYYYKTKSTLFTKAMIQLMEIIREKSAAILVTDQTLKKQLFEFAKAHLQAVINIDITAFMKEAKIALTEEQIIEMEKSEKALYHVLENALTRAMDRGEIPQSSPRLATLVFVNMLTVKNAMNDEYRKTFVNTEELALEITNFYWNGLSGIQ